MLKQTPAFDVIQLDKGNINLPQRLLDAIRVNIVASQNNSSNLNLNHMDHIKVGSPNKLSNLQSSLEVCPCQKAVGEVDTATISIPYFKNSIFKVTFHVTGKGWKGYILNQNHTTSYQIVQSLESLLHP